MTRKDFVTLLKLFFLALAAFVFFVAAFAFVVSLIYLNCVGLFISGVILGLYPIALLFWCISKDNSRYPWNY